MTNRTGSFVYGNSHQASAGRSGMFLFGYQAPLRIQKQIGMIIRGGDFRKENGMSGSIINLHKENGPSYSIYKLHFEEPQDLDSEDSSEHTFYRRCASFWLAPSSEDGAVGHPTWSNAYREHDLKLRLGRSESNSLTAES
jgi:hypothetical protein